MECACINVYDHGDACDEHTAKKVRARKEFKCGECPGQIMPGETYELVRMLFGEQWETHRTCPDCLSIRDAFFCGSYLYGEIRDYMREHIRDVCGELSETKISELTASARAWVCEEIEESWSDDEENQ